MLVAGRVFFGGPRDCGTDLKGRASKIASDSHKLEYPVRNTNYSDGGILPR